MTDNIVSLLHERELLNSRLEKLIYGSIEIRLVRNEEYIYVHRRINGISETKYVGVYSNQLYNLILENNLLAKEYKKKLKQILKELDSINYHTSKISEDVAINIGIARRNMVDSIYKQAMLEGVSITYSDTETIVNGGKVLDMSITDVNKVVNLKRAWEFILSDGVITYPTNFVVLTEINNIIEDGFHTVAGKLRTVPVSIGGSSYIPPLPIESIVKEELMDIINSELDLIDKTIELLLYVMKKQLFLDGNKRTAVILANHYLISHAGGLIVVPSELVSEYKKLLIHYYEDKSDEIKTFLKNKCLIKLR